MNRSIFIKAAAIAVVAGLSLSACSPGNTASPGAEDGKVKDGGDLIMVRSEDSTTLLPPEANTNADIWMLQQVYETLTVNAEDGSGVEPLLATEWTTSDDGLTWTFTIQDGVVFHDGSDLTADDVKWSLDFNRAASDTNQWYSMFDIITSVEAPDDETVTISLSQPWSALPAYLALFAAAIYPSDFGGADVEAMRQHPIGTGPFKFGEWVKGQSLTIEKNADYWVEGLPHLDSVTFNVVADDNTRMLQLQGGQAHIDEFPSPASMATLEKTNGIVAKAFDSTKILYLNLNNRKPGLDDPRVRRAMSYAVDRDAIRATVLSGYGVTANSFLAPGLAGHDDAVDGAVYNLDKAKAEMAKSGSPDGLSLTIEITSGLSDREQIAQILQQSWGEIGIDVAIKPTDPTVGSANRRSGAFDVQIGYATSDVIDPSQMVSFLVLTDGAGINSGYTNPEVYALADELSSETDEAKRADLLQQIQKVVADEAPIIPIAFQPLLYAYSDKVRGFNSQLLGTYTLTTAWLNE